MALAILGVTALAAGGVQVAPAATAVPLAALDLRLSDLPPGYAFAAKGGAGLVTRPLSNGGTLQYHEYVTFRGASKKATAGSMIYATVNIYESAAVAHTAFTGAGAGGGCGTAWQPRGIGDESGGNKSGDNCEVAPITRYIFGFRRGRFIGDLLVTVTPGIFDPATIARAARAMDSRVRQQR